MACEYRCTRQVEFHETDMAGIVHFAAFFPWMEETEHAFIRSLGLSVMHEHEGHVYTWPRVSASCDYMRPLRFEQTVDQQLRVVEMGRKSITYEVAFVRDDVVCARGRITAVCCLHKGGHDLASVEIPAFIREAIHVSENSPTPGLRSSRKG